MQRLLCILSGMNVGGAETFLMKLYRNIDRTKYQFDFCINAKEKCFYEDEILSLGGKIYRIPSKSENIKEFKRQLTNLIQREKYHHVLRVTSSAMGLLDLKIAKKAGAVVCCARSSNSSDGGSLKSKIAHGIGCLFYRKYIDVAIAPSDLAAAYTFGEKAYESGMVTILHNAVDLDTYHFDEGARKRIRDEFRISEGVYVLGHVGRFMEQKNHLYLADIFKCFVDINPNAILLLVGDGVLRDLFEKRVIELGIRDNVIFAGVRSDVPALLSAMDVFVFPSLYEGMPNTVIEAQATGLPCVISDSITKEAKITDLVEYLSLTQSPQEWAQIIINKAEGQRMDTRQSFVEQGYDIQTTTQAFIRLIFKNNI